MERKEPTIGSIVPDKDDIKSQQQRINKATPRARPVSPAPAPKASGSLGTLALVVAIAALGGSGFLAWKLQQSQQNLVAAEGRILELEKRLELSDDESSQSVTAIRAKLKWADSEIRKLWGVSYDTNRKGIKANKDKLASLDKSLGQLKTSAANAGKKADSASKQAASQQSAIDSIRASAKDNVARIAKIEGAVNSQRQQLQTAVDAANRASRLSTDLIVRVQANEEAIEAIDAYRRNINRDLLQLQQRLNQLQQTP